MIHTTLKEYMNNFNSMLNIFLNEYEDNSKTFFLQNEKKKYQKYQNALTKIESQMVFFKSEVPNERRVHKSIAEDLKNISPQAYKLIVTELLQITKNESLSLTTLKKDKILINEIVLGNHIKSSIRIFKFIKDEYAISINPNNTIVTKQIAIDVEVIKQSNLNDFTNSDIIDNLNDNKNKVEKGSNNTFNPVDKNIVTTDTFNENLVNDPVLNTKNEYQILKSKFKKDYHSKTAHLKTDVDFLLYNLDTDFDEWESKQKLEINNTFLKLIKELNQNKIFFFGCSFDNYRHNYEKRLNTFLEHYTDSSNNDFIEDELTFLENILYDLQNPEGADNGFSQSGKDNFNKADEFVSITGYKQYYFSHNKKENFLKDMLELAIQMKEVSKPKIFVNPKAEVIQEKPKTFELSKKLKKQIRFFKISESEQKEFDRLDAEIEENKKNGIIKNTVTENPEFKKEKKTPEKWYALLYLLELKATDTKPPTNYEGSFIKSEIEEIGKQRTGSTGQSFYRECLKINNIINNNSLIEKSFGKDWKQKIIDISPNNELIISYLNSFN